VAALKLEKGFVRVGDIAERLGCRRAGSLDAAHAARPRLRGPRAYGCVELTQPGKQLAERTESNRRVLTVFLNETLQVPEDVAARMPA